MCMAKKRSRGKRKEEKYSSKYANQMWINIIITDIKIVDAFI